MKRQPVLRRAGAATCLALVALAGLTSCTTTRQLTSPTGEWVAVDNDTGTLTIREDGTFSINDASYNPIQARDASGDFNASGTWVVVRDGAEVKLNFKEAAQGDFAVQPGGISVPFDSGSIRFHDPDEILDIEFTLIDSTVG